MILVHIITAKKAMAEEISDLLLLEKLLVDGIIRSVNQRTLSTDSTIVNKKRWLLVGKTRANLFELIDKELRRLYPENLLTLYSVPIVHMDWKQTALLKEMTQPQRETEADDQAS